jgi:histidine triad (HIT) family protein
MNECIFCKIAHKKIPVEWIFESEHCIAIRDINPQAPFHALIIPKAHYETINEVDQPDALGHLLAAASACAKKHALPDYRLVINTGAQAGQTVFHLHVHLLAGRQMGWPPG